MSYNYAKYRELDSMDQDAIYSLAYQEKDAGYFARAVNKLEDQDLLVKLFLNKGFKYMSGGLGFSFNRSKEGTPEEIVLKKIRSKEHRIRIITSCEQPRRFGEIIEKSYGPPDKEINWQCLSLLEQLEESDELTDDEYIRIGMNCYHEDVGKKCQEKVGAEVFVEQYRDATEDQRHHIIHLVGDEDNLLKLRIIGPNSHQACLEEELEKLNNIEKNDLHRFRF